MTARLAPHGYTEAIGKRICDEIADGSSFRRLSAKPGYPSRRTMRSWVERHPDFARGYQIAREVRIENLVDEMMEICDTVMGSESNAAVAAARLKIDTVKWNAARILPKKYGDRVEHVGAGGEPLVPVDNSKVALVLLSILSRHRPEAEDDEPEFTVLPSAPKVLLPEVPKPAEQEVAAAQRTRLGLGDAGPTVGPGSQWGYGENHQVRHVSELRGDIRSDSRGGLIRRVK